MMEKYGVETKTFEVVIPVFGKPDDYQVKGSSLSLADAKDLQEKFPKAIIRPE